MSAPPPGFNEQASNLPDPGAAAAPIHVMRGGGAAAIQSGGVTANFSMEEENILEEYGLTNDKITQTIDGFDDEFKRAFLRQLASNECSQKGNSITKKDCWAVTAVIRATIQANLANRNSIALPGMVPEESPEEVPTRIPGAGPISEEHNEPPENLRQVMNETNEDHRLTNQEEHAFRQHVEELGGEEAILYGPEEGLTNITEEVNEAVGKLPGTSETDSVDSGRMVTQTIVSPTNVGVTVPGTPAAVPVATPMPLGRGPAAAAAGKPEFEEMGLTSDFRKGQYGINLNANNSQRFYANALVGTKRMRIRGRNAANIKGKYNTKMATLKQAANNARILASEARQRSIEAMEARQAAESLRKRREAEAKAAVAERKTQSRQAQATKRAANVAAIQARRAAGEKLTLMNRARLANPMRLVNRFKRGGSRKTRRSTRRRGGRR